MKHNLFVINPRGEIKSRFKSEIYAEPMFIISCWAGHRGTFVSWKITLIRVLLKFMI